MAVSRPNGLSPVKHINGSAWNQEVVEFAVLATDATPLFIGDPVIHAGTADTDGVPAVTKATSGTAAIAGVVVGFAPLPTDLNRPGQYRAANEYRKVRVSVDPSVVYEVMANATIPVTTIGLNSGFALGTGSTTTGTSGTVLDVSSAATTATLPLKIVGIKQSPDNSIVDDNTNIRVLVMVNASSFANNTAGV